MEIFIRGLVALGIALAVAAYGFSDVVPPPVAHNNSAPAAQVTVGGQNYVGADNGYGWAPCLKGLFGGHGGGCHLHGPTPAPSLLKPPPPRTQPGTVVFPQHPFARSPRDFFMAD